MQHRGSFIDADRRLAAMAAHPSAQASPITMPAAGAGVRPHPAPGRSPMAAASQDRHATESVAPAPVLAPAVAPGDHHTSADRGGGTRLADPEDGSLVTEYGLLAVVAATVAGVVIQWASGGALVTLFNALLRHARSLVGA